MQNKDNSVIAISKQQDVEALKMIVREGMHPDFDPNLILEEVSKILPKLRSGNKQEIDQAKKLLQERSEQLVSIMGLENHYHIASAVSKKYRPLLLSVVQQIVKDYQCTTVIEKTTAELVAIAYIQAISDQSRLNDYLSHLTGINNEIVSYASLLSKQADRSYRHYISAVMTLRHLKQPQLEVNIRTNNAFVAQNQQVNANKNPNENIPSK